METKAGKKATPTDSVAAKQLALLTAGQWSCSCKAHVLDLCHGSVLPITALYNTAWSCDVPTTQGYAEPSWEEAICAEPHSRHDEPADIIAAQSLPRLR